MIKDQIQVSPSFKKQANKAIYSIILFIVSYILLLLLSVGLTIFCTYAGIALIVKYPSFVSFAAGAGLAGFGFLILFFLIKFMFKSNKIDTSQLVQIKKEEQPKLFEMISSIVQNVGTDFPKKVFVSPEVNASVFYDSNFWSMFFPVRKNLVIGMGLVNSITDNELKAILSHEFGHFSQESMKVGSYVYNVNQIIYNMLYDNESFEKLMDKFAASSGFFSIFVYLAGGVLRGVQWILQKLYAVVNVTYMGLSREMEFHADEIAAQVTGYIPLKESLLRMSLANHSYDSVLGFYENRINDGLKSKNIYPEQSFLMNYLAKDSDLPVKNGFPIVSFAELNKFNKSKLVIKDQWASHPGIDERIAYLEKVSKAHQENGAVPAITIFSNVESLCEQLTEILFSVIIYEGETKTLHIDEFEQLMTEEFESHSFHKIYNSYYDQGNPVVFDLNEVSDSSTFTGNFEDLYSDAMTDLKFTAISLRSDIDTLDIVADKAYKIKTFDYDGKKYMRQDSKNLQKKLHEELKETNRKLCENDRNIFYFFKSKAGIKDADNELMHRYKVFFDFDNQWDAKLKIYHELSQDLEFTSYITPFKQITENFNQLKTKEKQLKSQIQELLNQPEFAKAITKEEEATFKKYLEKDWVYFKDQEYNNDNLNLIYSALNTYPTVMSKVFFKLKKSLLDFQVSLLD